MIRILVDNVRHLRNTHLLLVVLSFILLVLAAKILNRVELLDDLDALEDQLTTLAQGRDFSIESPMPDSLYSAESEHVRRQLEKLFPPCVNLTCMPLDDTLCRRRFFRRYYHCQGVQYADTAGCSRWRERRLERLKAAVDCLQMNFLGVDRFEGDISRVIRDLNIHCTGDHRREVFLIDYQPLTTSRYGRQILSMRFDTLPIIGDNMTRNRAEVLVEAEIDHRLLLRYERQFDRWYPTIAENWSELKEGTLEHARELTRAMALESLRSSVGMFGVEIALTTVGYPYPIAVFILQLYMLGMTGNVRKLLTRPSVFQTRERVPYHISAWFPAVPDWWSPWLTMVTMLLVPAVCSTLSFRAFYRLDWVLAGSLGLVSTSPGLLLMMQLGRLRMISKNLPL